MSRSARPPKLLKKALRKIERGEADPRELKAFHEAAHVVIAWALGVSVNRVTIESDEAAALDSRFDAAIRRDVGTWEENAQISAAGMVANSEIEAHGITLIYDLPDGTEHNDVASFKYAVLHVADLDVDDAQRLAGFFLEATETNLRRLRVRWLDLAQRLSRCREMDAAALERVLGPLPEIDPETIAERARVRELLERSRGR